MFLSFIPKNVDFFQLFDKQAEYLIEAGRFFKEWVSSGKVDEAAVRKMHDIEHDGDKATYAIIDQLNKSFVTPFDREDIHALAKVIDDIIDVIRTIVNRMRVYQITNANPYLIQFGELIEESTKNVACAVRGLRNYKLSKEIVKCCLDINRLEKKGDSIRDTALMELFKDNNDLLSVIKLKEIYQDAETILDICEDVAHVVESILVKHA